MNCQLFDRYVFDYCDDNISPALKMEMDKHRQECSRCNNQFKLTNLETLVLRDKSDLPQLADDFTPRVMKQIMGAEQAATLHYKWNRKPFPARVRNVALVAAAAGLVLFLAVFSPQLIPDQGTQVADAPSVGTRNSSVADSSAKELHSASEVIQEAEITDNILYNRVSPQALTNEEANTSPARESYSITAAPDNNSAAGSASSELMISAAADPGLDDTGPADLGTESSEPPLGVVYRKTDGAQSPSRQGGIPDPNIGTDTLGNLPKPQQVPVSFTLIDIVNSNMDKESTLIEYHYADKDNRLLVISIKNTENLKAVTLMKSEPVSSEPQEQPENASPSQVEVTYNIDVNGQSYQVTLNGTLSAEELGSLAEIISFSSSNTTSSQ